MRQFLADLHIHSRFSYATSTKLTVPVLAAWAQVKGLAVIGTGDFTHPGWREELRQTLTYEEATGLYTIKDSTAVASPAPFPLPPEHTATPTRFMLQGEISSIYKRNGKARRVHNLVYVPTLEAAEKLSLALGKIGNLDADGRPILKLDSRNLLEMVLETHPEAFLIPAHIWTPWYSLFGSKSGFDDITDCYGDLTGAIFALETGLSSDPAMNRLWSALDNFRLISNSDAHSAENLGREANIFSGLPSYSGMLHALKNPATAQDTTFCGTVEFYPEEGKYHLDGHRKCGITFSPAETRAAGGTCPVCGGAITVGVLHRVMELADRAAPLYSETQEVASLVPLTEILGEILGVGPKSRKVHELYTKLLSRFGAELCILRNTDTATLAEFLAPLGEAIARMRQGTVHVTSGSDGEYGTVRMFSEAEHHEMHRKINLPKRQSRASS